MYLLIYLFVVVFQYRDTFTTSLRYFDKTIFFLITKTCLNPTRLPADLQTKIKCQNTALLSKQRLWVIVQCSVVI